MSTPLVVTASVTLTNIISISSVLSLIWPHASAQRSDEKRRGGMAIEFEQPEKDGIKRKAYPNIHISNEV